MFEVVLRSAVAWSWSAVLVQMKGCRSTPAASMRATRSRETRQISYPPRGSPDCRYRRGGPHRPLVGISGCNDRVVHEQPLRLRAQVSRASGAELGDEEIKAIDAVARA